MKNIKFVIACILVTMLATTSLAATITSTAQGGLWSSPASWLGGVVPDNNDDVVISGLIQIANYTHCQNLNIEAGGTLTGATTFNSRVLYANGNVHNAGSILNGQYSLTLNVSGNLHNEGIWNISLTKIQGLADRTISQTEGVWFQTALIMESGYDGLVRVITPIVHKGALDMTDALMILEEDTSLTIDGGTFVGNMHANGNDLHFLNFGRMQDCVIDNPVLTGDAKAGNNVVFTNLLTVMDSLKSSSGGGDVTIEGDLLNYGLIRHNVGSLGFHVHGDIENHGNIDAPILDLVGVNAEHRLSMSEDAIIESFVSLSYLDPATLIIETPIHNGFSLHLGVGDLVLEPGCSSNFVSIGAFDAQIFANGNEITPSELGDGIGKITIDQAIIAGEVFLQGECLFTGGLTVEADGSIGSWSFPPPNITVEGLFLNRGLITDGPQPVFITALGDIQNDGFMTNSGFVVAGSADQSIGTGDHIDAQVTIESNLEADSYQWFLNGSPIFGENNSTLDFSSLGPGDFGVYHCVGNGLTSRSITIDASLATSGIPDANVFATLEQNHPNPFNPSTEISFSLLHATEVSLVIYDLAGRQVQSLVQGPRAAGRHVVSWQPKDIASGTYFYKLKTEGNVQIKKCLLVK